jgi:hypothetical protein
MRVRFVGLSEAAVRSQASLSSLLVSTAHRWPADVYNGWIHVGCFQKSTGRSALEAAVCDTQDRPAAVGRVLPIAAV